VLLSIMGLLLFWLISKAEKLCMPWMNREAEEE